MSNLGLQADAELTLEEVVAALDGPIVIEKGAVDRIAGFLPPETTDGSWRPTILECAVHGAPRRPGGLGDFLAGSLGTMLAWYLGSGLILTFPFFPQLRVSRPFPCMTHPCMTHPCNVTNGLTRARIRDKAYAQWACWCAHRRCISEIFRRLSGRTLPPLQGGGRDQTK